MASSGPASTRPGGRRKRRSPFDKAFKRVSAGAQNALEVVRLGRLTPRRGAPYDIAHQDRVYRLRHYAPLSDARGPQLEHSLVLIPPLMLTAEIYDVSPDLSAVAVLARENVDTWVIDFGAPEQEEGGMERTLDDHVRAVADAVNRVKELTGGDVHLAGYSQGGMFAYQSAAYLRSQGIKSVITFGSPVNIHVNLPGLSDDLAGRFIEVARRFVEVPLDHVEGLPGILTSTGFKLLTPVKEAQQMFDFVAKLHDRQALEKRESRRRFLGGEGFVSWPGPALRKFIDEFVVHNRMASGGFVIEGRTVTLADIDVPVLCFVGERDDIARPPSVRAIVKAAPNAEVSEIPLRAGHFGLVVGSKSLSETWPSVTEWMRWQEGVGPKPRLITEQVEDPEQLEDDEVSAFDLDVDLDLFVDTVTGAVGSVFKRVEDAVEDAGDAVDNLRYQVPRVQLLRRLTPDTRISMSRVLAERARETPDQTFFLFRGRAFSYGDADRRINYVVRGLISCGVRRGTRVGVLMDGRPSYLTVVTALNRIGAISVLLNPNTSRLSLEQALDMGAAEFLVADPGHAKRGREAFKGDVLVLGGGGKVRSIDADVIDMEQIDPHRVELPAWYEPNPGRASDLALIMFSSGRFSKPRAARITNRRWAFSAYGAAAACTLTPKDTVYSCLPLHHPSGMLVGVGAGLVGEARLALASRFTPELFWQEVRRYGATVVFYAGEMCRELLHAPASSAEHINPLRLFAGSGMRDDLWQQVQDRFEAGVLEFYASSEGNVVLANTSGEKAGALGRPLPGATDIAVVSYDFEKEEFAKDENGWYVRTQPDEPGVMIARVDTTHPASQLSGYSQDPDTAKRVRRGVFESQDIWYFTGDLVRRDPDGDYWYVDRLDDMVRTARGPVATTVVEDALYKLDEVAWAVAYSLPVEGTGYGMPVAAVVPREGTRIDAEKLLKLMEKELPVEARPRFIRVRGKVALTDGYRPLKTPLREAGIRVRSSEETFWYDSERHSYEELDAAGYREALRQLGGTVDDD